MKKDWTYKKLGEVCDILNGYAFKSNKYVDKGIRVIRIANVQKGVIVDDQPAFYPLSTQSEIDKYILNEGDILMSLTGNVGRVGILQKEMLPAALNQRVACLRMIDNSWYSKFFFHYLNSDLFEQKCIASARGIAQLNMSTEWLKEQFIPIPPLSIQHSIVAELDLLHSVISKKKEQLRELDNLAQSLFYQMFGDPITNPMGWEKVPVSVHVADKKAIKRASKRFAGNDEIEYIDISSINNQSNVITDTTNYIFNEAPSRAQQCVAYGDILISLVRPNLRNIAVVCDNRENLVASSGFCVLRVKETTCLLFLKQILLSDYFTQYLLTRVSGANYPAVHESDILDYQIITPPLSLQQSFAAKVSAIEAQKQAITQSIQHTEALLAQRMDQYFA